MNQIILLIFVIGYGAIAFESKHKINKSAIALVTGVLCWMVFILFAENKEIVSEELAVHLSDVSGILFFLMGAMTIVELIDRHEGFDIITTRIRQRDKRLLLWMIAFITFFLSAVLDNLTTTIVIVSLLRKLINNEKERVFFAGIVVIAANAGGAWTPIGDVTTTMLWMGGQITSANIMMKLLLPSLICLLVPLIYLSFVLKGEIGTPPKLSTANPDITERNKLVIFTTGILSLVMVPIFKTITHLPPYMGILFGLGLLWILTELMHRKKESRTRSVYSVSQALQRIDLPSILFFLGILICIAALQSTGLLQMTANWMDKTIKSQQVIVILIGLLSSVVDNVPLVAAAQGMYKLSVFPTDHYFWEFLAYAAGTGGSILIIGSAAGVAAMGMEKIDFFWYMKKISLFALLGYLAGCATYMVQAWIMG
ncbi:MAG: sodium:proton antiporter NhaD [Marinilabiliales bacterium]|nr:sodium:proton antiporter NhaD [Marinilabiliales bacterium]